MKNKYIINVSIAWCGEDNNFAAKRWTISRRR